METSKKSPLRNGWGWIATSLSWTAPHEGIDIGVKVAMYKLIYELKRQGKSIVMISEELMELIGMSDRMLIMKNGSVSKEIMRSADVTDAQIIEYMI